MIVISAGMQKSGSAWYFNMTNELMVRAGLSDVHDVRDRYRLGWLMRHRNCNIGWMGPHKLLPLLLPHSRGHEFVVKTHRGPTTTFRLLERRGVLRATYICRDPRDVVMSALDHGAKLRAEGRRWRNFARLRTFDHALVFVAKLLRTWSAWADSDGVLLVRYEDLLADPTAELERLVAFLDLDVDADDVAEVSRRYRKDNVARREDAVHLHLNRGVAGRYAEVMTDAQIRQAEEAFGPMLTRMGYAPHAATAHEGG